ncbi:MAG: class I SAM-dependent methyltransferase [Candidatus Omnitrophica bacterium]|nr:class I SAM-dependent methyltransferase [Candidatus Omnitrophota bacterium]
MNDLLWRLIKSFSYRTAEAAYRIFPKKATLTFYCYMTYIMRALAWRLACKYYGRSMTEHRGDIPDFVLSHIMPGDIVIDVGCAEGNLTRLVAKKAKKVIAVDIDKDYLAAIDKTEEGLRNATFIYGDIVDLKFDETFDVAILVHTIEHMDNANTILNKISGIARKIIVETPDQESDWLTKTLLDLGIEERGDDKHVKLYDGASLKESLEQNGWSDVVISKGVGAVRAVAASKSFK